MTVDARTVLTDGQWNRIKGFLSGKLSVCLLSLCCGLFEWVPHGVIYPMILGISTGCMSVIIADLKKASGNAVRFIVMQG